MRCHGRRWVAVLTTLSFLFLMVRPVWAADPEIDRLLRSPVGKDWITNGGNLSNQRFSTLKQVDTTNVKQLKGAWMTRLKGSGASGKYSFEASPLVKDGIMYVITGNDDVFALNAKTGEIIWEYWSGIDQKISTVCCGWVNRGLAMGEGKLFFGQLDANVVALDVKTGKVAWKTPIEKWENGYTITSAPLYYDGVVYSGVSGGEFGVRGRLTSLDAKSGEIVWRWYTLPGPGEFGSDTWPAGTDHSMPIGSPMSGTFTAIDSKTNKIAWQHKTPYRIGGGGGSTVTAGGLVFRGEPDGNFLAIDAKTGQELWRFQTGFGADAPPVVYEVDGEQYIAIATGGNQLQGSAYGDAVWAFSLKGQLNPLWPPPLPQTVAGPTGPIVAGVDTIKMGGNNVEYGYVPARVRIKAGTTLTFINVGDLPHTATAMEKRDWDTGALAKGGTTTVTFSQPGNYYYICLPHPWMYGQVIVE